MRRLVLNPASTRANVAPFGPLGMQQANPPQHAHHQPPLRHAQLETDRRSRGRMRAAPLPTWHETPSQSQPLGPYVPIARAGSHSSHKTPGCTPSRARHTCSPRRCRAASRTHGRRGPPTTDHSSARAPPRASRARARRPAAHSAIRQRLTFCIYRDIGVELSGGRMLKPIQQQQTRLRSAVSLADTASS